VRTGQLRWHFQFTPSDEHDWDSAQQPVLANIEWQGQQIPALLFANRNAFFYALDRRTGRFLFAKPFAKQTWASGIGPDGRPIPMSNAHLSQSGILISPSAGGATNWWSPSFDPQRKLLFVPAIDAADVYFEDIPSFRKGIAFTGGGAERPSNQPMILAVRAIDVSTGELRWDSTLAGGGSEVRGAMGGVLSTNGDLVFAGYGYEFFALDADTGAKLWITPLGGMISSPPISYALGDQQYIAIVGGRTLFVFALPLEDQGAGARALPTKTKSGRR